MSESRAKRQHIHLEAAEPENGPKHRLQKKNLMDRIQILAQKGMHLTSETALASSIEYYRFMALKATFDIDGIPSKLASPGQVDDLWHAHLLDTRSYAALESLLLPNGGKIHHNPVRDEQPGYLGRLQHTRNLYYDMYHTAPPLDIWGDGSDVAVDLTQEGKKDVVTVTITYHKTVEVELQVSENTSGFSLHEACLEATNGFYTDIGDFRLLFAGSIIPRDDVKLEIHGGYQFHVIKEQKGC